MSCRFILAIVVLSHLLLSQPVGAQAPSIAASAARIVAPPDTKGNLAWWSADDHRQDMTIVEATIPTDLSAWKNPYQGLAVAAGQPDARGGKNAFRVTENVGATWRWIAGEPTGYVSGPCQIAFQYKPINGGSVWVNDGTTFFPEFEFTATGEMRVGNHPYASGDNTWANVAPSTGGFFKVDLWLHGEAHLRKSLAFSTVSNGVEPAMVDAGRGFDLDGLTLTQRYVTKLKDRSPAGADLTTAPADAPFLQRSGDPAGLLTGGSCLWQPDESRKFLATAHAPLLAALGGAAPHTIIALVRRQWCRGEGAEPAAFLQAVAASGQAYTLGVAPGRNGGGNQVFAGAHGVNGPIAAAPLDTEWNAIAVICTGATASIYLLDGDQPRLIAEPKPISRGVMSSLRLCLQRCALRELAVWDTALDLNTAHAQAQGMVARAGGTKALNTFKTFDGLTIETRTKAAPYHRRDDSGVAFYKNACWILGGAAETVTNANDVWKSTDYGATWTSVEQKAPFTPSQGAAAFTLTVKGTEFLYCVGCYENRGGDQTIYRTIDGSTWTRVCDAPPWKNNFGMAVGVLGGDIFVMGGQTRGRTPPSAVSHVFKSSDGGATWTQLPDAPWRPRMAFGPLLPFWKGKLWLVHGGTYGQGGEKFNDIWTFDGKTWTRVLERTPWPASLWSTAFVLDDELFIMSAHASDGDHRMMWRSADGVRWRPSFPLPWSNAHESCAIATDRGVLLAPTDWNQTTRLLNTRAIKSGIR